MRISIVKVLCITLILFITVTKVSFSPLLSQGVLVTDQASVSSSSVERTSSSEAGTSHASESSKAKSEAANKTHKPAGSKSLNSERTEATSEKKPSSSGGPYDMKRIRAFNRALYGS